jgi:hypothetical protein
MTSKNSSWDPKERPNSLTQRRVVEYAGSDTSWNVPFRTIWRRIAPIGISVHRKCAAWQSSGSSFGPPPEHFR